MHVHHVADYNFAVEADRYGNRLFKLQAVHFHASLIAQVLPRSHSSKHSIYDLGSTDQREVDTDFGTGHLFQRPEKPIGSSIKGGRDYGASQFNRATRAQRQTGSSFKPYVYATAMENGFTPDSIISDGPISWGTWSPKNYTRGYSGRMTLTTALVKSINTVPVRLAKDHLSIPPIKAMTEAMGVESPVSAHKTMVLGTSGLTVMDQATGYSVLAQDGMVGTRHGITQLVTPFWKSVRPVPRISSVSPVKTRPPIT